MSENDFWRRYFWGVQLIKERLLVDYAPSNTQFREIESQAKENAEAHKIAELERWVGVGEMLSERAVVSGSSRQSCRDSLMRASLLTTRVLSTP